MKRLIVIFICIVGFISCRNNQKHNEPILFKTLKFTDNEILGIEIDTFAYCEKLDLDFYKKNFLKPYYYPEKFIDKRYRNETIVIWSDSTKIDDFISNWTHTYKYDSLSRITEYSYSGCLICSQLPFSYSVYYDKINRPIRLVYFYNSLNNIKDNSLESVKPYSEYTLKYDNNGNIIQMQYYTFGKLNEQIDKL